MTSGRRWVIAVLVWAFLAAGAARAERYAVEIDLGDGMPITLYCADSSTYTRKIDQREGIVAAPDDYVPPSPDTVGKPVVPAEPVAQVAGEPSVEPAGLDEPATARGAPVGPGFLTAADDEPSAEFVQHLAQVHGLTDPADVRAVWRFYRSLPDRNDDGPLSLAERAGNAVVAFGLAQGFKSTPRAVAGASVEGLGKLTGETARVRASGGLGMRTAPWGRQSGTVPAGATVDLLSQPDDSGWCHVRHGTQEGWVSGLWLDP